MKRVIILLAIVVLSLRGLQAQVNTDKLMNVGANAMYFKDYVLSIQYFNKVIQAKPYLDMPYLYRAYAKIHLEDYHGAMADVDSALSRNAFIPMAYYAKGYLSNRLKKYEEAERHFGKALELSPENLTFMFGRLESYDMQKKYNEELEDLNFIIKKTPSEPLIAAEKARVQVLLGDTVGAIATADSLLRLHDYSPDLWGLKATLLMLTDQKDSALTAYDKAISLRSDNFTHFVNRGNLRYEKRNYRGAIADYNRSIELSPESELALFNRALIMIEVGDYNQALADLNAILKQNPSMDEARYERAIVSQRLGRMQDAIKDYSDIIEKYDEFVPAYYQRAAAYEALGKKKLAYQDMQATIRIEQNISKRQKSGKADAEKTLDTSAKTAKEESKVSDWAKLFDTNPQKAKAEGKFGDNKIRGAIQNRNVDVVLQADFRLSFYRKQSSVEQPQYFLEPLNKLNRSLKDEMTLYMVAADSLMTDALIAYHFNQINNLSKQIAENPKSDKLLLLRAINFSELKDLQSALGDLNSAIEQNSESALAYFERAGIRLKLMEVEQSTLPKDEKRLLKDYEMIFRDYDMALRLYPEFAMALYNKANLLSKLNDFEAAIKLYTKAIELQPRMAEAYYNRGLTKIYLNQTTEGIADLSKAGELGIYSAYNLIKKLMR